jgi:hypothetical protein
VGEVRDGGGKGKALEVLEPSVFGLSEVVRAGPADAQDAEDML